MVRGPVFKLRQASVLAVAISMAFSGALHAGPQGAVVVSGQVAITQPSAGTTQIQASHGAIINWQNFSIGAGEVTRFVQPSASSAVLNRVVGQQASQLLGQLQANGRVFLINPNGIAIGSGARIDTNGFIASTLNMTDADFLAGKLRFFADGQAAGLTNRGLITVAPGGQVALIAPMIENSGVIHAPNGQILLAAGHKIEIASLDFDNITFEVQAPTDAVLNLGKLLAENGAIRVFAGNLRHEGEIQASAMVQDADGSIRLVGRHELNLLEGSITRADGLAGGTVQVESPEGTVRVAGEISAQGQSASGGTVHVLGERVAIAAGSIIDASGAAGGGEILVGGDFQGNNTAIQNAQRVYVGEGAQLKADALDRGDGGRIIVWADENTRYFGHLSAQGGRQGGDGGFAEVSGKQNLEFQGGADLSAANGTAGTLLLDPLDIIVAANGGRLPGHVAINAQAGSLSGNRLSGGVIALNSSGFQSNTVDAGVRVDAVSTNSSVSLTAGSQVLRVGNVNAASSVTLSSAAAGITQVAGGRVQAPQVWLYSNDSPAGIGSAAAPLQLEAEQLRLYSLVAPAFINIAGTSVLNGLWLDGTVAGLAASVISGTANLTTFALSSGPGGLNLSAVANAGFANGFDITVRDGGIVVPQLALPGAARFNVAGAANFGNVTAGSFNLTALQAVEVASLGTTNGGISISTGNCQYWNASCTLQSPVTLGALTTSAGGSVNVSSTDNGDITIASINAGSSVNISGGEYGYAHSHPRDVSITVGGITAGGSVSLQNRGAGGVTVDGALTAGGGASFQVQHGQLTLQEVTSNSGGINASVKQDILFTTLTANGSGSVTLASSDGWIRPRVDSSTADIVSGRDVSLSTGNELASGIGNPDFTNPLDIKVGADGTVSLLSASSIGAPGRYVNVDVQKGLTIESGQGQFHVAARNAAGELQSVRNIDLGAVASGIGAGNTVNFVSQDLTVVGSSDGNAIDIGDVIQTTGTLDSFRFSSGGSSEAGGEGDLVFGQVNLATTGETGHPGYAGFNQLSLSAAGNLIQTNAGSNTISAGYTNLMSGGDMLLGDVNILSVAGNALNISASGDLAAGNFNAPSLSVYANNMLLGSVATTGTNRGWNSWVYVPRAGQSQYVTDDLRLFARGSVQTAGNITSATSVTVDAANGLAVVAGAGNITGGNFSNSWYTDTIDARAGSGVMGVADITANTVRISGETLAVGDVQATGGDLTVSGENFATGDLIAHRNFTLDATGAYQPGAITISAGGTARITADDGIELDAATFSANQVYLRAASGPVSGSLNGTVGLDVLAGGTINLTSDQALSWLTLQAKGAELGGASMIAGVGQSFAMSTLGGDNAELAFNSTTGLQLRYTERSPAADLSHVSLSANLGNGSYLQVNAGDAALTASSIATNGGVLLNSKGDMHLGNVATTQSNIHAESSHGDLSLDQVTTAGGSVTLISRLGSIFRSGAGAIEAGNAGVPSGTVSLRAAEGSVGTEAAPITVSNARSLVLESTDEIAIDMANTVLTNLQIISKASGSGNISLANNPGYDGFSLSRVDNNFELGAVQQRSGHFHLVATDGGINLAGNITLAALTLDARSAGADIVIAEADGARNHVISGSVNIQAGQDLLIQSGSGSNQTVQLQTGSATLNAGRDLKLQAQGASLGLSSTGSA